MKLLLLNSIILAATLILPSCSTIDSAREDLAAMPEAEFLQLEQDVWDAGRRGGEALSRVLDEGQTRIAKRVASELRLAIGMDRLQVADLIQGIVDEFEGELGLKPEHEQYIRDGAKVIDAAVGQIRLGIDGALSEREKRLLIALLDGLEDGIG